MTNTTESNNKLERNLELVVRTGLLLAKNVDLRTLVQSATDAGLALCEAEFGAFFCNVIDSADASYPLYALSGVDPDAFSNLPMPQNTEVFAPTFERTGIVRSSDITKDPRYGRNALHFGMPEHVPVRSYLAIQVKAQTGEVLGGLFYGHSRPDVFDQEAEELVATIAAQAAIAIENARLRDQLTRKVSDLELAEMAQHESAKYMSELAAIVESSDDAILSKDLSGTITSWNKAATRLFGYDQTEIVGRSILTLIPQELQSEETIIIGKIKAGERIDHFETVRLKKNGERMAVSLTISPVRDRTGSIVGASKILRDISGRKRIEASLLQAEKIAAAGRMAATIAHEVNNPLEAVTNLIYLARSNAENPDLVRDYLRAADNEVMRVSHIAKQTLGFYRDNASPTNVSLSDLASDAIRIYEPKCRESSITIRSRLLSATPIKACKGEIVQVISNLIANAIYAMRTGGTLTITTEDVEWDDKRGVRMALEDTGVGIPPEHISKVFDAFYTTRESIGTGIGLFVVKQFVEGHQGKVDIVSSIDPEHHGTKVSLLFPAS